MYIYIYIHIHKRFVLTAGHEGVRFGEGTRVAVSGVGANNVRAVPL